MNHIKNIYCLGIPSAGTEIELNFNLDKNITFLTGHNGVGKTKILKAIHENICLSKENKSFQNANNSTEYLIYINFEKSDRYSIIQKDVSFHNKISYENSEFGKKLQSIHKTKWPTAIKKMKELYDEIDKYNKQSENLSINPHLEKELCILQSAKRALTNKMPNSLFFSYDTVHYSGNYNDNAKDISLDHQLELTLERFKKLPSGRKKDISQKYFTKKEIELIINNIKGEKYNNISYEKLSLLEELLKNTNQSNKNLAISKIIPVLNVFFKETNREIIYDDNEVIKCKLLKSDEVISWRELSKGEKSIIFLCFSVYFYSNENVMFLIDEPETALHISWQEKLVTELVKLSPNSQFIIATHAPSIIFKTEQEQYFNLENYE